MINNMKQCIDSNQLKELNPDQFRNLCKLVGDKYHYDNTDEQINKAFQKEYLTMYISILGKTNIGKMLEILLGCSCIDCTMRLLDERVRGKIYGMELRDALWVLIKEYLNTD